jgi:signal-transduction protein with cAMP-binding, CBS, and nucleotidyltransferase domain
MIAHLNDQILLRLIALLRQERFADLPQRFALVVLGSEGRGEQTLLTDQDNAISLRRRTGGRRDPAGSRNSRRRWSIR